MEIHRPRSLARDRAARKLKAGYREVIKIEGIEGKVHVPLICLRLILHREAP